MGVFTELKAEMLARQGASVVHRYSAITSPVLLAYGDVSNGGMVSRSDARDFERSVAQAETALIPGFGHNLHHDAPGLFLAAVRPFLKRHAATASRIAPRQTRV
jgi:pimeloyl-ACP methyl ester carboxylesterase